MGCTRTTLAVGITCGLAVIVVAVSVVMTMSGGETLDLTGLKADGAHERVSVGSKTFNVISMNEEMSDMGSDLGTTKIAGGVMLVILAMWMCGHHGWLWRLHHGSWCPGAPVPLPGCREAAPPGSESPGANPRAPPTTRDLSPVHVPPGRRASEGRDEAAAFLQDREFAGRPRLLGCPMGLGADPQQFMRIQEQIYNTIDYDHDIQRDLRRYAALGPSPGEGLYPQHDSSQVRPPRDHQQATGETPTVPTDARPRTRNQGACDPHKGRTGVSMLPAGHHVEEEEGPVTKRPRTTTTRDYTAEDLYSPMTTPDA